MKAPVVCRHYETMLMRECKYNFFGGFVNTIFIWLYSQTINSNSLNSTSLYKQCCGFGWARDDVWSKCGKTYSEDTQILSRNLDMGSYTCRVCILHHCITVCVTVLINCAEKNTFLINAFFFFFFFFLNQDIRICGCCKDCPRHHY